MPQSLAGCPVPMGESPHRPFSLVVLPVRLRNVQGSKVPRLQLAPSGSLAGTNPSVRGSILFCACSRQQPSVTVLVAVNTFREVLKLEQGPVPFLHRHPGAQS